MSTFLELCQKAAFESGVVSGTQPTSVTGQSGTLARLVNYTADAFEWVENEETNWAWMQKAWTGALTLGNRAYTPSSFSLTDHAVWIIDDIERSYRPTSIYLTATGVSDEQPIYFMPYEQWQRLYDFGAQTQGRPTRYTISPAGAIIFAPTPDAAYTARGMYRRAPVRPTANADTPGWPARFHQVAAWHAAHLFACYDKAWDEATRTEAKRDEFMAQLRRDQLPPIRYRRQPVA